MYDQDAAGTAEIGDLIVDVLLGCETVDKVADTLNLPKGQVFGWCDRVRESLGAVRPWHSQLGQVAVHHSASWDGELAEDTLVIFEVFVRNESATTLYGVRLIQRSFTNADMDSLEFESSWKFIEGTRTELPPGGWQRYRASYRVDCEDIVAGGPIVNAVAVVGRTAVGQEFAVYQDALVHLPVWHAAYRNTFPL